MKKMISTLALGTLLFLQGCSSPAVEMGMKEAETKLNLTVFASGTKTPLSVHFFALESDEQFKKLDYFELMKKKQSKLNGDIVSQTKKILVPSAVERQSIKLAGNVHFYAVVAGFKDVEENDNWRFIQEIKPGEENDLTLILFQDHMKKADK